MERPRLRGRPSARCYVVGSPSPSDNNETHESLINNHLQNECRLLHVHRPSRSDPRLIRGMLHLPAAAGDLVVETGPVFLPAMRGTVTSRG